MVAEPIDEQIRLYARLLKLPTFVRYPDVLRRAQPNARFDELLLELMKTESAQRLENQNRKRLRAAGFPYTKTLEELDLGRYDGALSDVFVNELASCRFIADMVFVQTPAGLDIQIFCECVCSHANICGLGKFRR